jgi:CheY-like chemotaxis protein
MQDDMQKILNSGMDGHIAKPLDVAKALQTMEEIMRKQYAETTV